MRRRVLLAACMLGAGCGNILGLQDRRLEDADSGTIVPQAPTPTPPPTSTSPGGDAGDAADATGPCDPPGAAVYAYARDDDYRYRLFDAGDAGNGFDPLGVAFRVIGPNATGTLLPMGRVASADGTDEAVATEPSEGANGYMFVVGGNYGPAYELADTPTRPPGTVLAARALLQDTGPHHRLFVDMPVDRDAGWEPEDAAQSWWVCPRD